MKRPSRWPLGVAILVITAALPLCAAERYHVIIQRSVPTTMRDGVVLHADIYRPDAQGRFPVILERTPYNKDGSLDFAMKAAEHGYIAIVQDVRGRYTSQGEWYPFMYESQDGYDTVEWAAALPYSDGKVGMVGGSYVGATQMLAAIAHPPHLAGIFPVVTASNYHDGWTYQGGAFEQWFNESWTSGLAQNTIERRITAATNAREGMWTLPLSHYPLFNFGESSPLPSSLGSLAPYFIDWLMHPSYDDYWKRWAIEEHYPDIKVPAYIVAAWYDIFQGGSLKNYAGIRDHGGTETARNETRLMVVIGGHAGSGRKIGEVDFGPQADFDLDEIELRWYDHLLKGVNNGVENEKPVRIFVLGENTWRDESSWPLERAKNTNYYLHSDGKATLLTGDGSLSTKAPQSEPGDQYVYDPENPVPTLGGPLCCDAGRLMPGPVDQRPDEARPDVLVFTTPALRQDLEITGHVKLELYASSSAVDTDFTGKLVDVWPNGFAQNLTEGIVRARYRDSQVKSEYMNPGQVYKFAIDLWSTSNVFKAGHKLRLEVSSSNFPRFDRNPNTGASPETAKRWVKATNVVYHDSTHPSVLVLPVVPR
ncbi:MAG: CocE/NonD family hydrolase [Acidobacteria bacterium]|nr:MAG: CocE/NonD family hydrolase [Acidobacteriota bacterium]